MKASYLTLIGCLFMLIGTAALADSSCHQHKGRYETKCQCTERSCYSRYDSDCISSSKCCEAFGNAGAR
jgi:hypothetical protein